MAYKDDPSEQEEPLDPAAQRLQKKLRRLILISGLTMVLGLAAVFAAIVYRINRIDDTQTAAFTERVALQNGDTIVNASVSEGRLTVLVRRNDGHAIIVFDAATGARLADIAIETPR
ncbi:MAG: DUF6476 family protein [Pseudomonadota bacterium]